MVGLGGYLFGENKSVGSWLHHRQIYGVNLKLYLLRKEQKKIFGMTENSFWFWWMRPYVMSLWRWESMCQLQLYKFFYKKRQINIFKFKLTV